jgi:hypothetical protein
LSTYLRRRARLAGFPEGFQVRLIGTGMCRERDDIDDRDLAFEGDINGSAGFALFLVGASSRRGRVSRGLRGIALILFFLVAGWLVAFLGALAESVAMCSIRVIPAPPPAENPEKIAWVCCSLGLLQHMCSTEC